MQNRTPLQIYQKTLIPPEMAIHAWIIMVFSALLLLLLIIVNFYIPIAMALLLAIVIAIFLIINPTESIYEIYEYGILSKQKKQEVYIPYNTINEIILRSSSTYEVALIKSYENKKILLAYSQKNKFNEMMSIIKNSIGDRWDLIIRNG